MRTASCTDALFADAIEEHRVALLAETPLILVHLLSPM
jgi:hypothetical protein